MERMVLDAVRSERATAPSRTAHFCKRSRAVTPFRELSSDSSDVKEGGVSNTDTHGQDSTDLGEVGDSSSFGESDSAGEMTLITAALKPGHKEDSQHHPDPSTSARQAEEKTLETDPSSQDITLSEVREQALDTTSRKKSKAKGPTRRSVEFRCARSFLRRLRGQDPLFLDQQTQSITHTLSGATCVRKTSRSKPRGPSKSFGTIEVNAIWDETSAGGTNTSEVLTQWQAKYNTGSEAETGSYSRKSSWLESCQNSFTWSWWIRVNDSPSMMILSGDEPLRSSLLSHGARTQLNIVSDFLQTEGDLCTLLNLWARISSFTDHQAALCDFDWGEERISVRNFPTDPFRSNQLMGY